MALIHSTVLLFREFFSFKSAVGISASLLFSFSTTPKTPNTPNTPKHAKTAVFCLLLSLCILSIQIQAVCLSLLQPFLNTPVCGREIYPLPCMFSTLESAVSLDYGNSFPYDSFPYCKRSFCERNTCDFFLLAGTPTRGWGGWVQRPFGGLKPVSSLFGPVFFRCFHLGNREARGSEEVRTRDLRFGRQTTSSID